MPKPVVMGALLKASMKVPPKRKGNVRLDSPVCHRRVCLNESPSEKEGKSVLPVSQTVFLGASMKVPPKRKGNMKEIRHRVGAVLPQ